MKFTVTHVTFAILGPVFQEAAIVMVNALVVRAGPVQFTKFGRHSSIDGSR